MTKRKLTKSQQKEIAKQLKKIKPVYWVLIFVMITVAVLSWYFYIYKPQNEKIISGDLQIHFLELGTKSTGDCVYIKCGNLDIIVDGGAEANATCVNKIYNYISPKMTDDVLDFAIITHAHEDHYAGFSTYNTDSLFDKFNIDTIIDFPKTDQSLTTDKGNPTLYSHYVDERQQAISRGSKHFTALECWNNSKTGAQRTYELNNGTQLQILYNYYYEHSASKNENLYSVCFQIVHGNKYFLFTGDLEEEGEAKLVTNNTLHQVELFKAGHHGSYTASSDALLSAVQPKICAVTCVAGTPEYYKGDTQTLFPSQTFINNISKYTDKVYITSLATNVSYSPKKWDYTSMNGNIVVTSNASGVSVNCSNNNTVLKDTAWFQSHRTWPA